MTPAEFASYIRWKTKTDSSSFTDAEVLIVTNLMKDEIAKEVTKVNENYFGFSVFRNLEAGVRNYSFEGEILNNFAYFEAKLNGTDWKQMTEYTLQSLNITTNEADVVIGMADKKPGFAIFGNEIILLNDSAIISVVDGMKMWVTVYPANLTSLAGTDDMSEAPNDLACGFPRQLHELLARRVIIEYKQSQEKPLPLTERENNYKNDLEEALNALRGQNLDRSIVPSVPYDDGSDY